MNSATVYEGTLASLEILIFVLLDKHAEVSLQDHMVLLILIFLGISILFSVVTVPFCIPTNRV